jgi:hypothetical protein
MAETKHLNGKGVITPQEYGRLPLLKPVTTASGKSASEIIIFRPSCRAMTEVLDTLRLGVQIDRFVSACCRAVNGSGEPLEFSGSELSSIDGSELASVITAMSEDADAVQLEDTGGDGVTQPMIYTLQRPIKLTPGEDGEEIRQLAFEAKRVGDISEFLDARGETKEFHTFMRTFGQPLGMRVPIMTDALINALDFLDYLVIRRQIMGKFINSRGRWKKTSSLAR